MGHEMAHLRRQDVLWNTLGKLAVLLFWPNPLQWLLLREMEITQELACDEEALHQIRAKPHFRIMHAVC
jgi:bla regulator protein BlaR1